MKVTLRDIAKATGLSVTTVSRALNGYDDVAEETKEMVRATAVSLGYAPNLNARRLKTRKADAIGLILPYENLRFSDPFFSDFLSGIVEQNSQFGLELNVNAPTAVDQEEALYLEYIRSHRVDGFIVVRIQREDARVRLLQELNFPFIPFGRTDDHQEMPFFDEDGELGIRLVIDHLVELGHRRIACITEPLHLSKSHLRLEGYLNGLHSHGLDLDQSLIVEGSFRQRSGRSATHQLLDLENPPTAVVAVNDLLALGAMKAVQERGLTVGKDISITGFDDILLAEYANPPLTTLHQPANQMGHQICQMLYQLINHETMNDPQIILPPTLIVRGSTGPVS